jgi:hypothetical protein
VSLQDFGQGGSFMFSKNNIFDVDIFENKIRQAFLLDKFMID